MKVTQNDVFDAVRRESGENPDALCDSCSESMEGAPVFSDVFVWVCAECATLAALATPQSPNSPS